MRKKYMISKRDYSALFFCKKVKSAARLRCQVGICLAGVFWALCVPVTVAADEVYSVGIVPQFDARKIHAIWQPILTSLEKKTGLHFRIKGAPTIPVFERQYGDGAFDFAYMNPYHVLGANKDQGYVPLVRDVGRSLYGVLVVKRDSPYKDVRDLAGKVIAMPAPNALGASMMIRADFSDIFKINTKSKYVQTHSSVYFNVLLGQADAGGGVQKTLAQQKEQVREGLRVLYETRKVPPHPFVAHPRVPPEIRERVKKALLALGSESEGKKLLARVPIKKIGAAQFSDYLPLTKMGLERFFKEE